MRDNAVCNFLSMLSVMVIILLCCTEGVLWMRQEQESKQRRSRYVLPG